MADQVQLGQEQPQPQQELRRASSTDNEPKDVIFHEILDILVTKTVRNISPTSNDSKSPSECELSPKSSSKACAADAAVADDDEEDQSPTQTPPPTDSIKKESQDNNNSNIRDEVDNSTPSSALGRNRRVRQKNRYLLDFHCTDLTKGGGRSRDDYDAYAASTSTRSSNRRSTTDSSRKTPAAPATDEFEEKYCRRCSSKTAHHQIGGCQSCMYKKIVQLALREKKKEEDRKKVKVTRDKHQPQYDKESTTEPATPTSQSSRGTKRKATKQTGSATKVNTTSTTNCNSNSNPTATSSEHSNSNVTTNFNSSSSSSDSTGNISSISTKDEQTERCDRETITPDRINKELDTQQELYQDEIEERKNSTKSESNAELPNGWENSEEKTNSDLDQAKVIEPVKQVESPSIDLWSPDQVAEYILSKGFANEAELFKAQSVDGISLLLMQRSDFTYGLRLKLGPALKIFDQVCRLKKEFFRKITTTS